MLSMFKKGLAASVLFFSLIATGLASETYKIDPAHTYVAWYITHLGFSIQTGKFVNVTGTVVVDEANPQKSEVKVTVPTADLITGIPELDKHLKSDDFFNVARYPTATFVSNKIEKTGPNSGKVQGTLTLLGVSKPVVLNVRLLKEGLHPMTKKKTLGFEATATIKRSDFGMNSHLPALGDEVKLIIGAEAANDS